MSIVTEYAALKKKKHVFLFIFNDIGSGITCGSWRLEASISNGYDEEHLIRTVKTTDSHIMCVAQCSQETQCITVGYSEPTGACDMYNTDLTDQQAHLSFQAATVFYKGSFKNPLFCMYTNMYI